MARAPHEDVLERRLADRDRRDADGERFNQFRNELVAWLDRDAPRSFENLGSHADLRRDVATKRFSVARDGGDDIAGDLRSQLVRSPGRDDLPRRENRQAIALLCFLEEM